MYRIARFIYFLVAIMFLFGMAADLLWGPRARRLPQPGEEGLMRAIALTAVPLLAGLIFCCVKLKSCRLSIIVVLTVLWLGIYTWLYWFSFSAPASMTEQFLDPDEMRAERFRHFSLVTGMYLLVVATFSLLPLLKFLQLRREPASRLPV